MQFAKCALLNELNKLNELKEQTQITHCQTTLNLKSYKGAQPTRLKVNTSNDGVMPAVKTRHKSPLSCLYFLYRRSPKMWVLLFLCWKFICYSVQTLRALRGNQHLSTLPSAPVTTLALAPGNASTARPIACVCSSAEEGAGCS